MNSVQQQQKIATPQGLVGRSLTNYEPCPGIAEPSQLKADNLHTLLDILEGKLGLLEQGLDILANKLATLCINEPRPLNPPIQHKDTVDYSPPVPATIKRVKDSLNKIDCLICKVHEQTNELYL